MTFHVLDSIDAIVAAAARHGLVLQAPTLDTSGLDFVVVHGRDADGTRWIVRAPRRPDVAAGVHKEARILAAVRDALPVAVPDWRIVDEVIAYPRLEGLPLITLDTGAPVWNLIDPAAPAPAFLAAIGELLAALQRVTGEALPVRSIEEERADVRRIIEVARPLLEPPADVLAAWQQWVDDDAMCPTHVALAHNDLHPGHILLDAQGLPNGVLDWTEARLGDPGSDFAMMVRCFGRPATLAIAQAFAAAGGVTWPRLIDHAVARASFFPAAAADWAERTGSVQTLAHARSVFAEQLAARSI